MANNNEIERRRTFAIIAHPDAGKTSLTEKLLLFGGQIQVAGAVKSNKIKKTATSDWMDIEKQRGISVTTSVMEFDYHDYKINILDTPGHQDFAEDTYRTLTAVDSVIIVVDGAKGVETQTRKLMEVCRMRNTPVIIFINKMDLAGADRGTVLAALRQQLHSGCTDFGAPPEELAEAAEHAALESGREHILYSEMILNPTHWPQFSVPEIIAAVTAGFDRAAAQGGADCRFTLSLSRTQTGAEAMALVEDMKAHRTHRLAGLSIDGNEALAGRTGERFRPAFLAAGAAGFGRTAHAGESSGPDGVRDALDLLEADRLDHGGQRTRI